MRCLMGRFHGNLSVARTFSNPYYYKVVRIAFKSCWRRNAWSHQLCWWRHQPMQSLRREPKGFSQQSMEKTYGSRWSTSILTCTCLRQVKNKQLTAIKLVQGKSYEMCWSPRVGISKVWLMKKKSCCNFGEVMIEWNHGAIYIVHVASWSCHPMFLNINQPKQVSTQIINFFITK